MLASTCDRFLSDMMYKYLTYTQKLTDSQLGG